MTTKGKKHSEATLKKMSEDRSAEKHPFFGKKHSKESLEKMSLSHKGKKAWNKGISHSKETRIKIGLAGMGRIASKETRIKMSIAMSKMANTEEAKERFKKIQKLGAEAVKGKPSWNRGKINSEEHRRKISIANKGRKCDWVKGEKNWNWKGGVTPENKKIWQSIEMRLWRESVFSRDNWTCQKCKIKGGKLHPHHIQNFAEKIELRSAIDNGVTLCVFCHKEFHHIYGNRKNNIEQLLEYLSIKK